MLKAGGDPILTPPLREALAARLERKEQALLLLNRRGYATSLLCRECGLQAVVPQLLGRRSPCTRAGARALCHYCAPPDAPRRAPAASCKGEYLRLAGLRHGEGAWRRCGRRCPRRASSASTATSPCAAARWQQRAGRLRGGGDGHPRRHADDRQGPRLPARDAGGRDRRRRRPRPARLPRRRAHVPAPDPGRGPRRPRRPAGRGHPAEPPARPLRAAASPARRTTTPSTSGRWSSAGRWPTRRRPRW